MQKDYSLQNIPTTLFYFLLFVGLGAVLYTVPFLRYPYDSIAHMIAIDEMYHGVARTTTSIQNSRLLWHKLWAGVFHLIHLDSAQFFLRAKIIHVTQTYIALFSIYYFSKVVIRNIFVNIPTLTLKYLSFWSVVIWLTVYATFSVNYHMVWSLWYSLTYQITLPLFFYMMALTLVLFLEPSSMVKKVFFTLQVLALSYFILRVHSMEYLYYGMYLLVFVLLYIREVSQSLKKHYLFFLPVIALVIYFFTHYQDDDSRILKYLANGSFVELYQDIMIQGNLIISRYNRASSIINELMYLIFYTTLITLVYYGITFKKHQKTVNPRMFAFLLITSLFIFIPLYPFTAGLFALITKMHVVHRIYFASSLFVLLPVSVYFLLHRYTTKVRYMSLVIIVALVSSYFYSTYTKTMHHNYHKNIQSLRHCFLDTYNFPLSQKDITLIHDRMERYIKSNRTGKPIQYFARSDVAFVLLHLYGQDRVYGYSRRDEVDYKKAYQEHFQYDRYHLVLFDDTGLPHVPFYK